MTLVHGWLLLAWMGCTSVPIEPSPDGQEASSRGDLDVSVGVLSLQRSALEEFAGDVFSNTAPVTLPGMAGWPVVVQLGQTRVRFDPSADKGDGRIQGIAHLETLATLIIPPFFQADDFPLHLSMPLSFEMKPGQRTCMEHSAIVP